MFKRATHWYGRLLSWLLVASVAILVVPVSLQIFSRYTALIPSYIWTEEMARFFFVWSIMLLRIVASLFVLLFALVFLWWGIDFTRFAFNRISELAELPLWYIHVAWPLAGATWVLFLGEQMWGDLRVLAS